MYRVLGAVLLGVSALASILRTTIGDGHTEVAVLLVGTTLVVAGWFLRDIADEPRADTSIRNLLLPVWLISILALTLSVDLAQAATALGFSAICYIEMKS
jgi:hypothetical protein